MQISAHHNDCCRPFGEFRLKFDRERNVRQRAETNERRSFIVVVGGALRKKLNERACGVCVRLGGARRIIWLYARLLVGRIAKAVAAEKCNIARSVYARNKRALGAFEDWNLKRAASCLSAPAKNFLERSPTFVLIAFARSVRATFDAACAAVTQLAIVVIATILNMSSHSIKNRPYTPKLLTQRLDVEARD